MKEIIGVLLVLSFVIFMIFAFVAGVIKSLRDEDWWVFVGFITVLLSILGLSMIRTGI